MPNGEILSGDYTAVREIDQFSFTSATMIGSAKIGGHSAKSSGLGFGSKRMVGGQGKAYALLTSLKPGSKLVMEVIVIYGVLDGHGFGEARTNDGRSYKVQF